MDKKAPEGEYVNGLFLEGARWDADKKTLTEAYPRILYDVLPIIWLSPIEKVNLKEENTYECPLYKTSARRGTLSTTGYLLILTSTLIHIFRHSTNYVTNLRIPTISPSAHWIRRGVAGLLALND